MLFKDFLILMVVSLVHVEMAQDVLLIYYQKKIDKKYIFNTLSGNLNLKY